jgi:hypothetical protein
MTLASVPGNARLRGISSAGVQKATLHTICSSSVNESKAQILQEHWLTLSTTKAARFPGWLGLKGFVLQIRTKLFSCSCLRVLDE